MKTADQVSADDRMVLARALCSWSGSDRHAIEIPNHQVKKAIQEGCLTAVAAGEEVIPASLR